MGAPFPPEPMHPPRLAIHTAAADAPAPGRCLVRFVNQPTDPTRADALWTTNNTLSDGSPTSCPNNMSKAEHVCRIRLDGVVRRWAGQGVGRGGRFSPVRDMRGHGCAR